MPTELIVLALVGLLQAGQLMLAASLMNRQLGAEFNTSPRDTTPAALTGLAGRADRALKNHYESLPLFIIAVLVVVLGENSNWWTGLFAWTYLGARVLYVPAYLYGWTPWRSVIWFAAFLSVILLLVLALI